MNPNKLKSILVIGAGWEQYELVKTIKENGHYIVATHPHINADSFELADVTYVKDSRDVTAHLLIADTHNIDAVITDNCDYSFYTAAIVASKYKLPFASVKSAIFSNNKLAQRSACMNYSIKQPKFKEINTLEELYIFINEIKFPIILKPIDNRGTFGVTIINNEQQLENAFFEAIQNSHSRRLICEQYIQGTLITVDGFCFKNGHRSLTVASRIFEPGPKPITKEVLYPSKFSEEINEKLLNTHSNVVNALDYKYGHTHGEYILNDDNEIYFLECANRGAGVYSSTVIIPRLIDINLNENLLNQSLGIDEFETEDLGLNFMKKSILLTFLDFEVGKVIRSINFDEVRQLPYVVKFRTIFSENEMVETIENCASRHSMIVIDGDNIQNTYSNFDKFKKTLSINYY